MQCTFNRDGPCILNLFFTKDCGSAGGLQVDLGLLEGLLNKRTGEERLVGGPRPLSHSLILLHESETSVPLKELLESEVIRGRRREVAASMIYVFGL